MDKVSPGQKVGKPSASLRNTSIDISKHWNIAGPWNNNKQGNRTPKNFSKVQVKNSTGGNLARGSVVEFGDFLLAEIETPYLWFDGVTPDTTRVGWGILERPIPNGEIDS